MASILRLHSSVEDPHHLDADPDPTFHFDADPDPYPSFQIILVFHLQIDADLAPAYQFDANPDPTFQYDADLCGSGSARLLYRFCLYYSSRSVKKSHYVWQYLFIIDAR